MKTLLRLGAALLVSGLAALAGDLTITMQNSGKYNEGRSTQYWSADYMRTNHEGTHRDHMVDYKNGVVYNIDHGKKKIEKMSFDDMLKAAEATEAQMAQFREQMANMPEIAKKMMGDPDAFSVDELGKDTVAGRKCNAYRMVVAKLEMEMSLDPSLKMPVHPTHMARFAKFQGLLQGGAMGPGAGSFKKLYEEMSKLKGVTLKTVMKLPFVGETRSEATKVDESAIPASVFALPLGYTVEDTGKKMLEQAQKAARKGR